MSGAGLLGTNPNESSSHMSFIEENTMRVLNPVNEQGIDLNGDVLSELVPHRKHQNLTLLIQDFAFNQIGGIQTEKIVITGSGA